MKNIDKTLEERGERYGEFRDNAKVVESLLRALRLGPTYGNLHDIHRGAYYMIFQKIARSVCGDCMHVDNVHDIIGYATLLEEYITDKNKIKK